MKTLGRISRRWTAVARVNRSMVRVVMGSTLLMAAGLNAQTNVLADADNPVWVRVVSSPAESGFDEWDVISRVDGLIDRVRVPDSKRIAGFAPGVVYLVAHDGGDVRLEKVRIR